ncbi:4Fe-4S binding domain-containing protein [Clostridium cavendishii DSM 21758]|uniref:4Fe-4S binding domain-containing protein n=1 Tax=Clostridium cavendishii DSM 21758 TaxID=1121302 RepID=A0A1M6KX10_9CLOT|nr:4Fe-4S binding protein [Clostridium cavendishii]SHJ63497.1 4Fe-4S binding domain-containing protein [Clostridium cavendishii DSM 21758]
MLKLWKKYSYLILMLFLIVGLFDFRVGLIATICMFAPVVVSFFKGRFWCGNICPRGSFYDNFVSKFANKKKTPKFLKTVYFRIVITVLMLTVFTSGMIKNWGNIYGMGFVVYRLIVVTTIIGLILSLLYNERTWCNFCPMGSIAALISKFKNKGNRKLLLKVNTSCISCKLCEKNCPMGIAPYQYKDDSISHHDCIQCGKCVYKCPKKSIKY